MAGDLQGQPDIRERIRSGQRAFPTVVFGHRLAQTDTRVSHSRSHSPFAFTLAALTKEMNKPRIEGIKGEAAPPSAFCVDDHDRWRSIYKEAVMNIKHIRAYLVVCSLVVILQPLQGL